MVKIQNPIDLHPYDPSDTKRGEKVRDAFKRHIRHKRKPAWLRAKIAGYYANRGCKVLVFILLLSRVAFAGDTVVIGVQAPMHLGGVSNLAAQDYWNRYPDVAADSYYGRSRPTGAQEHFSCCGRFEGRTWNEPMLITGSPASIGILTYCGDPGSGGFNCVIFPNGARLGGFSWQSTVKVGNSEVLASLVVSSKKLLLSTHHLGQGIVEKQVILSEPIDLAPGSTVWIYAEGTGNEHCCGFEAQVSLFVYGQPVWNPQ